MTTQLSIIVLMIQIALVVCGWDHSGSTKAVEKMLIAALQ